MTDISDLFDLGGVRFLDLGPGVFGTVNTAPDMHGRYGYCVRGSGWFECGTGATVAEAESHAAASANAH